MFSKKKEALKDKTPVERIKDLELEEKKSSEGMNLKNESTEPSEDLELLKEQVQLSNPAIFNHNLLIMLVKLEKRLESIDQSIYSLTKLIAEVEGVKLE